MLPSKAITKSRGVERRVKYVVHGELTVLSHLSRFFIPSQSLYRWDLLHGTARLIQLTTIFRTRFVQFTEAVEARYLKCRMQGISRHRHHRARPSQMSERVHQRLSRTATYFSSARCVNVRFVQFLLRHLVVPISIVISRSLQIDMHLISVHVWA